MTPERLRALLEPYLNPLPHDIEDKVQKYMDLLDKWGARMPLTSVHDPEEVVRFHFGESIFALSTVGMRDGRLADVGSGAGFPGLAIKLANPALSVTLIEPNKKKCAFLHEVVRSLELNDVQIIASGFDSSGIEHHSVSLISCRALGQRDRMLAWSRDRLIRGGLILLWLGDDDARALQNESGWKWDMPSLIPGSRARFLLRGRTIA